MFEFINDRFMGATVSIAITGLPVVLTGQVVNSNKPGIIGLKQDARIIYIEAELVAFVF